MELCAGGHSTRRKMDSAGEGTVEVVPLELYDSARAKIDANLRWLFAKAYGIGKLLHTHNIGIGKFQNSLLSHRMCVY